MSPEPSEAKEPRVAHDSGESKIHPGPQPRVSNFWSGDQLQSDFFIASVALFDITGYFLLFSTHPNFSRMFLFSLLSALGGMGLSVVGMMADAFGYLLPIQGVIAREVIVLAMLNAVRASLPFNRMTDF